MSLILYHQHQVKKYNTANNSTIVTRHHTNATVLPVSTCAEKMFNLNIIKSLDSTSRLKEIKKEDIVEIKLEEMIRQSNQKVF